MGLLEIRQVGDPALVTPRSVETKGALTVEKAREFFNQGVALAASLTWMRIQEMTANGFLLPEKERKKILDNLATSDMTTHFATADFGISVLGCEGKKELRKDGVELETLEGLHGAVKTIPDLELFIDPIEGTTAAASNRVGSVCIVAGGLENGHNMVPPEDGDAQYLLRTVASPRLRGRISLDMSPSEVVKEAKRAFNLSSPSELRVVVLDRLRNAELMRGLEEAGATLVRIEAGDLMPALASLKHTPILSMGSGGKEEGMIAAIAAKAVGGFFEGRYVDKDGNSSKQHPQRLILDSVCPGDSSRYFVSLASITGTPEYGLGLFRVLPRGINGDTVNQVSVVDITKRDLFRKRIIDIPHISPRT